MKFVRLRLLFLILLLPLATSLFAGGGWFNRDKQAVEDTNTYASPYAEDNERCFKCHGQNSYEYTNDNLGRQVREIMCSERVTSRKDFYDSNHKSFSCTDCHSEEYTTFPHPGELRMEQKYNCIDCHGGDDNYAMYHFDEIDIEYQDNTHYQLEEEGFTCWKCHDPHSYKINIRDSENIRETILYDNNICLNCHSDFNKFQLLSERDEINILSTHSWLPDQASHFKSVRCIECHTKINDSILVAHQILPKEEAVRRCNECHSQNSLLMASLYKFESKAQRSDGFFNGIILNQSYVIGANRNEYLNIFSLIILAAILGVIGIHIIFRVLKKQRNY